MISSTVEESLGQNYSKEATGVKCDQTFARISVRGLSCSMNWTITKRSFSEERGLFSERLAERTSASMAKTATSNIPFWPLQRRTPRRSETATEGMKFAKSETSSAVPRGQRRCVQRTVSLLGHLVHTQMFILNANNNCNLIIFFNDHNAWQVGNDKNRTTSEFS